MIIGTHPMVRILDGVAFTCHLIGSRNVGPHNDRSDWDFLVGCTYAELGDVTAVLEAADFIRQPGCGGYGPDARLLGVWTWSDPDKKLPGVDVLVAQPEEVTRRLRFFDALKRQTEDAAGKLCLGLKRERSWGALWKAIAWMEEA